MSDNKLFFSYSNVDDEKWEKAFGKKEEESIVKEEIESQFLCKIYGIYCTGDFEFAECKKCTDYFNFMKEQ